MIEVPGSVIGDGGSVDNKWACDKVHHVLLKGAF